MLRIHDILGPRAVAWVNWLLRRGVSFSSPLSSWEEGKRVGAGYQEQEILNRVITARSLAKVGAGKIERDGVVLSAPPEPPWRLLAAVWLAMSREQEVVRVLDFGGGLGSTFDLCERWMGNCLELRWFIVEQGHVAAAGRVQNTNERLKFGSSIEEARQEGEYDLCILSGVLQYLRAPEDVATAIVELRPKVVLVERTPVASVVYPLLTVQKNRYPLAGRYPAWLFPEGYVERLFEREYVLWTHFKGEDTPVIWRGRTVSFNGAILRRK